MGHSPNNMKLIPLSRGQFAKVDDEDYERIAQHKWHVAAKGYASRHEGSSKVYMHREVLAAPMGFVVDHANGDRLDNRRANLRLCTHSQNSANMRLLGRNTSGFKGVTRQDNRWKAQLYHHGRNYHLGLFDSPVAAALAYNNAAKVHFGPFAHLNVIPPSRYFSRGA